MMYDLNAALALSPGNKAQTMKHDVLIVVCQLPEEFDTVTNERSQFHRIVLVSKGGEALHDITCRFYQSFLSELKLLEVSKRAIIWHSIGYTSKGGRKQKVNPLSALRS